MNFLSRRSGLRAFCLCFGILVLGGSVSAAESSLPLGAGSDRLATATSPGAAALEAESPYGYWTPLQLSLANPVQVAPDTWSVAGLRINLIWGENFNLAGIDAGLANGLNGFGAGLQAGGVWNFVAGDFHGIQFSGLVNYTAGSVFGLQAAGIANAAGRGDPLRGLQVSLLNYAGDLYGGQIGLYNTSATSVGIQLGLVNTTKELQGLQIGLINIHERGWIKFFPGINFCF